MRSAKYRTLLALAFLALSSYLHAQHATNTAIDVRVNSLLSKMTLDEKVGQLNQLNVDARELDANIAAGKVGSILNATGAEQVNKLQRIAMEKSRLHIPILFGYDVIHGYRTIFPIPLGIASTWDPAMTELSARVAAKEASAAGIRWTFSPMVDIARDPRWGRIAEGAGEDQVLGARIAAAYVRGYQGTKLSDRDSIAACAKHFVGYGAAEGGRDYNSVDMSERKLRDTYLPPFKAALDAGAATFMSSFNTLNGVPASANPFTLREILKGEWGFRGFVVSDWNSIGELIPHGVAADKKAAAQEALTAGVDMDMTSDSYTLHLAELVRSGAVSQATLDDAVRRVLRVKFELGLFENPYADPKRESEELFTPANLDAARKVAQKSIVLLKNEGGILPIKKTTQTIAVIGPLADSKADMLGNWFAQGRADEAVTVLEGLRARAGSETKVVYEKGGEVGGSSAEAIAAAVTAVQKADVAVVVLGEKGDMSGEAASRAALDLPGDQQKLLEAVHATGKPVVLVLMSGRPLAVSWAAEHVPAIMEVWFPGTQGGNAVADVLFGDVNPSGKLPVTFPRSIGQVPMYYSHLNTGRPWGVDPKYQSGYLDAPPTPLWPFGFGLSYTTFEYKNLRADSHVGPSGTLKASVEVRNTGTRDGEEVVQLYVRDVVASVARPVQELKAFQRVRLAPGESRKVEFTIGREQLAYWTEKKRFSVDAGEFIVKVGPSSTETLQAKVVVDSTPVVNASARHHVRSGKRPAQAAKRSTDTKNVVRSGAM